MKPEGSRLKSLKPSLGSGSVNKTSVATMELRPVSFPDLGLSTRLYGAKSCLIPRPSPAAILITYSMQTVEREGLEDLIM